MSWSARSRTVSTCPRTTCQAARRRRAPTGGPGPGAARPAAPRRARSRSAPSASSCRCCLASGELGREYLSRPTDEQFLVGHVAARAPPRPRPATTRSPRCPRTTRRWARSSPTSCSPRRSSRPARGVLRMSILQLEERRIEREIRRAAQDGRPRAPDRAGRGRAARARRAGRRSWGRRHERRRGRGSRADAPDAEERSRGADLYDEGGVDHRRRAGGAARAGGRGRRAAVPALDRAGAAAHARGRGAAGQAHRAERHVGEERADRGEPAAGGVDREALHRPRADAARPDPGGQPRG